MFEILKAVLFGVVEGITEWLPVSSTGHMILLDEFVKMNVSPEFWDTFLVVIQLGAILAVVLLYWGEIWPLKRVIVEGKRATNPQKAIRLDKGVLNLWGKTIVACLPAAIIGVAFDDWLNAHFYNWLVVSIMLIVVGVAFIIIENRNSHKTPRTETMADISYKEAFAIGLFQVIAAVFPGTSRSGATIIGGILLGMSRKLAAEYTFFLAIPVMFGASFLKLIKFGLHFTGTEVVYLLLGMVVAFGVSIAAIKFLMGYIKKHDFKVFGWYRIALGVVVLAYFLLA